MDKELELLCQRYLASKQNRFKNDIIEELAREAFEPLVTSISLPEIPSLEPSSHVDFNDCGSVDSVASLLTVSKEVFNILKDIPQFSTNFIPTGESTNDVSGIQQLFKNYDELLTISDQLLQIFHMQEKLFSAEATTVHKSNEDLVAKMDLLAVDTSVFGKEEDYCTSSPINIRQKQ